MLSLDALNSSLSLLVSQTKLNLPTLGIILLILWGSFLLTTFVDRKLLLLGIMPRHILGMPGILVAPILHYNFNHLFFNSIPLVVLANFILMDGFPYFIQVTLLITLISGLLIWCFAKSGIHLGASGVITGYWSLLVSNIWTQGTITAIILGLISIYYFAGIFFGIFPSKKGVSWEGHFFGLIAGVVTAYITVATPSII